MAEIAHQSSASGSQVQSTNITQLISASRTSTLESNRPVSDRNNPRIRSFLTVHSKKLQQWIKTQLKVEEVSPDGTEKLIKEELAGPNEDRREEWWTQGWNLQHLLSDYGWIKDKPGHDVALELVQTWLFEDGTDAADIKSMSS